MMKKRQHWLIIFIFALSAFAAVIFLRPVADLDFLYINYPEVKGHIPESVIGTSIVGFLDPSFYYKFPASEADAVQLAGLLKLKPVETISNLDPAFQPTGMFWHDWTWWHPNASRTSRLYNAYRDGNEIYLVFDFQEQVIYLYIQNT